MRYNKWDWLGSNFSVRHHPIVQRTAREFQMTKTMITSDPAVMMGKPVVAGTRITVEMILRKMGADESIEQLLDAHPRLTRAGILAALDFAAGSLGAEVVRPLIRRSA